MSIRVEALLGSEEKHTSEALLEVGAVGLSGVHQVCSYACTHTYPHPHLNSSSPSPLPLTAAPRGVRRAAYLHLYHTHTHTHTHAPTHAPTHTYPHTHLAPLHSYHTHAPAHTYPHTRLSPRRST